MRALAAGLAPLTLALAACGGEPPAPEAEQTEVPAELQQQPAPALGEGALAAEGQGTPMAERVATLGIVNKRNSLTREIEMKPGEARRIDDLVIRLSACEKTAPWEDPPETGAFVQVNTNERPDADSDAVWTQVFSGWLFKNSPGLNVVEHPIYDVWVKDCAMSFPGEEQAVSTPSAAPRPRASAAPAEPEAAPAATPAPSPTSSQ